MGDFKIKEGNIYLFTCFDENNPTDIFAVENNDVSGIKLKNVEGDMWERFEQYINEGRYFEAEQERRQRLGLPLLIDNPIAMGGLSFVENPVAGKMFYIILLASVIVAGTIGFTVMKKRN